jgi:RNA polymerase sigma factor (sigma-70 family)
MEDDGQLATQFEEYRTHLRGVAYRLLGSCSEADDAVQESWLRIGHADTSRVENLGGWLTTIVARVCVDMLRSRPSRREEPVGVHLPDPIVSRENGFDPEQDALLADSVGIALLVILSTLAPAERVAFVLHDMFAVPFDEIAPVVGRSPAATRQLASRARRRVQEVATVPDADLTRQREAVDAFFSAARDGNLDALVAVLDPRVTVRFDGGPGASGVVRGASAVARQALRYARPSASVLPALVNGTAGVVVVADGQPVTVMAFTVTGGRIATIESLADPERLSKLDLPVLADGQ